MLRLTPGLIVTFLEAVFDMQCRQLNCSPLSLPPPRHDRDLPFVWTPGERP